MTLDLECDQRMIDMVS